MVWLSFGFIYWAFLGSLLESEEDPTSYGMAQFCLKNESKTVLKSASSLGAKHIANPRIGGHSKISCHLGPIM